jgi:L-ribulose-5-phosphate 4-epimerase
MLEKLKKDVFDANLELLNYKLVILTWGNVSGFDPDSGLMVIKPSGLDYKNMTAESMVVLDMNGKVIEGKLNPSSDTPTHIELYRNFKGIKGVVHTHSRYATAWAQSGREIPCYGTTQADYFYGSVPCTRSLNENEVILDYEKNTGLVIVEKFKDTDHLALPGVLVGSHGPFCWGENAQKAVENALVLEEIATMAYLTESLGQRSEIEKFLLEKHFMRKHGKDSYYGQ